MHGPVVAAVNVDDDYSFAQSGKFEGPEDPSFSFYKSGVMKQDQRPDSPQFAQAMSGLEVPENGSVSFAQTGRGSGR